MKHNERQEAVLKAMDSNDKILVVAPPGAGKTFTLVEAVKKYCEVNPMDRILVVTFTNKATDDLKLKTRDIMSILNVSTIHSWSLKELKRIGVKYNQHIDLLDEVQIKAILQELLDEFGYKNVKLWFLYYWLMVNRTYELSPAQNRIFNRMDIAYTKYKRDRDLYDFGDLPLYLSDMLRLTGEVLDGFDAIFVDEFQDVDDIQLKIFLDMPSRMKFFIADPDQAIYIFRGATEENLKELVDFNSMELNVNYRSGQAIIDFGAFVRTSVFQTGALPHTIVGSKVKSGRPEFDSHVYIIRDYVPYVYQRIEDKTCLMDSSFGDKNIVDKMLNKLPQILCRTNKQVAAIQAKGYKDVSTIHQAKGLEYDNVIVVEFGMRNIEDLNVMYVACTRPKDNLLIMDFENLIDEIKPTAFYERGMLL